MELKELASYGGIFIALTGVLAYFARLWILALLKPSVETVVRPTAGLLDEYIRQSDIWRREHVADTDRRLKEATDGTQRLQDSLNTLTNSISAMVSTQGAFSDNLIRLERQTEKLQTYLLDVRKPLS